MFLIVEGVCCRRGAVLTLVRTPLILVNFKTYLETTGKRAVELAKIAENISLETEVCIGLAPQFADIVPIARVVSVPVFAQHIDPVTPSRLRRLARWEH